MHESRDREANRVFFQAPARICATYGMFEARIRDISWSGIRLRLPRRILAVGTEDGLGAAAAGIQHVLGGDFTAKLDTAEGGAAIEKRMVLIRLSLPDAEEDAVDLGCLFEERLTDREAHVLGLELPQEGPPKAHVRRTVARNQRGSPAVVDLPSHSPVDGAEETVPEPEERTFRPRNPYRAVLANAGDRGREPLVCSTESFTPNTVQVRARGEMLACADPQGPRDAAAAAVEFTDRYGERVELELVDGTSRMWRGPTQVCCVEVDPARPRDILLRLAFGRPLQEAELRRLMAGAA